LTQVFIQKIKMGYYVIKKGLLKYSRPFSIICDRLDYWLPTTALCPIRLRSARNLTIEWLVLLFLQCFVSKVLQRHHSVWVKLMPG